MDEDNGIVFQHLIDLPNSNCVFCSAKEEKTGKTRLFLIFNEKRRIYIRNGLKETWDELTDEAAYNRIKDGFNNIIVERKIPCFSSSSEY